MNSTITSLSAKQLRFAASIKEKIASLETQLNRMLNGSSRVKSVKVKTKKRRMSASAKARLSAIAKARWRKARAAGKAAL